MQVGGKSLFQISYHVHIGRCCRPQGVLITDAETGQRVITCYSAHRFAKNWNAKLSFIYQT